MKKIIFIKNKKYFYFLILKKDFFKMLNDNTNKKLLKSFFKIMKKSRGKYFKLEHLEYEKKNIIYSLIINESMEDIISVVLLDKNKIRNVYTNFKYRGLGFCSKNLKKIIKYTNYNFLYLYVDIHNLYAISCYERVGFIINRKTNNTFKMVFHTQIR
jgi:hypothetical protein